MPVDLEALGPKLVNLLLETVFVVDASGKIVFINAACEQLLGYTADEMIGTAMLDYLHPDDIESTLEVASQVMSGQPQTQFENRYQRKDGGVVHILWSARWSEEDRVRIGIARDVTALRRAEQIRGALYRISEVAHAAANLRALCDGVRQVIGELFPGDLLYLAFYDSASRMLSVPDWSSAHPDRWVEQPVETESRFGDVIRTGQPLHSSPNQNYPNWDIPNSEQAHSLGVPLIAEDAVFGALVVERNADGPRYCDADRELLQFVATQIATMVERKRAEQKLRFLAHHDALTGLTNRSLFYDRIEVALRSASRNGSRLALLYLDLNDFKRINDTLGHEMGDQVIKEVARRLEELTRKTDTVGRMGGDEFTILLTDLCEPASVDTVVEKMREVLATPMSLKGETFCVSCSIGMALYPEDGATAKQLLNKADANMYRDKQSR